MSGVVSVHGHAANLSPDSSGKIEHRAWGAAYRAASADEVSWLHFAIPTPRTTEDEVARANRVYVRFRLFDPDRRENVLFPAAEIVSIGFWDGARQIGKLDDLGYDMQTLGSEWQTKYFDVPDSDKLAFGLGITLGVKASFWSVTIASVGCEFTTD